MDDKQVNQGNVNDNTGGVKRSCSSPTGASPPAKSLNVDPVADLVDMLNDQRVIAAMKRIADDIEARFTVRFDSLAAKVGDIETKLLAKNETLQSKIVALESKVTDMESTIENLQAELEKSEQYSRRNSLRIWSKNLEVEGEDTDKIVISCAQTLKERLQNP